MVADHVDPYADWPDRTSVSDASGGVTLFYSAGQTARDATPWADGVWVGDAVPTDRAAQLALEVMPGWVFSTSDPGLAGALLGAGAAERRHAHSMTRELLDVRLEQPAVPGLRIESLTPAQVDRHALRLGTLKQRAYPPDHPDALDGDEAAAVSEIRAIARGEILGPMVAESRIGLFEGEIAGACLIVDRPGEPPHGGPWVIDVFRDPQLPVRGVGAALLTASMLAAREARLPGMSLVVSHSNDNARRLYERLGFTDVEESWTLALPKKDERTS